MHITIFFSAVIVWASACLIAGAAVGRQAPDIQVRSESKHIIFEYKGMAYPYIGCDKRKLVNCLIDNQAVIAGWKSYDGYQVAVKCLFPLLDNTVGSRFIAPPKGLLAPKFASEQVAFQCIAPGIRNSSPVGIYVLSRIQFNKIKTELSRLVLPATQLSGVILIGHIEERNLLYMHLDIMLVDAYIPTGEGLDGMSYAKVGLEGLGYGEKLASKLVELGLM